MLGLYGVGFWFYASAWPERRWPGQFDMALHSHQLWHACIVGAVLVWYAGCVAARSALLADGCGAFVRADDPAGVDGEAAARGARAWPVGLRATAPGLAAA